MRSYPKYHDRNVTFEIPFINPHANTILEGQSVFNEALFQKAISSINRERIPERVVHSKGSTYYGIFQVTNPSIRHYTKASVFQPGQKTKVAVRFSTSLGERGASDTPFGEVRGMAVKFYTKPMNYDLLAINSPVFIISDPQLFGQLLHAQKRNPQSDLRSIEEMIDFFSLRPETLNAATIVFSDYGLPDGFTHMPAFAIHAFRLINDHGERFYGKFMWIPNQGIRNMNISESFRIAGKLTQKFPLNSYYRYI